MDDYVLINIDNKTLRCLEESINKDGEKTKDLKKRICNYYWDNEIEFRIHIQDIIELQNRIGGEFSPSCLGKLREYTKTGIKEAIFSRKKEYHIGPGYFRVYPIVEKKEEIIIG